MYVAWAAKDDYRSAWSTVFMQASSFCAELAVPADSQQDGFAPVTPCGRVWLPLRLMVLPVMLGWVLCNCSISGKDGPDRQKVHALDHLLLLSLRWWLIAHVCRARCAHQPNLKQHFGEGTLPGCTLTPTW
jgi:hypothetical protein